MITKTGIIQGKEFNEYLQNLTMIGNVAVNNGIASGFTTSNYFKFPVLKVGSKPWEINIAFVINNYNDTSHSYPIIIINGASYMNEGGVLLQVSPVRKLMWYGFQSGINPKWDIGTNACVTEILLNTLYFVKILFTGTQYTIKSSTDTISWNTEVTLNSTKIIQQDDDCFCLIGYRNSLNWDCAAGSIYLKYFDIKIEDKVIFAPSLITSISNYQITSNTFHEF